MTRKECIELLKVKMSNVLGIKKSEFTAFAEDMIEPFNVNCERECYYNNYADSFDADINYYIDSYKHWMFD